MPKLPAVSGDQAIRCFEKLGYQKARQRGSHIRLIHLSDNTKKPITIPRHKVLGKGLLRKLIRDADIGIKDLLNLL